MAALGGTDSAVPWAGRTLPSGATKGKKPKKDKKMKDRTRTALEKEGRIRKKKKKTKSREAMKGKKDKKKKSKKVRAMTSAADGSSAPSHQRDPWVKVWDETSAKKSAGSHPHGWEEPIPDGSPSILQHRRVPKTKKKVAFDLGYGPPVGQHPTVLLPPARSAEMSAGPSVQSGGASASDSLRDGAFKRQSKTEPQKPNESQGTSDDMNSQDLFITQNMFRAPPVDQSSEESPGGSMASIPPFSHHGEMREKVCRHKEPPKQQDEELSQRTEEASARSQKMEMELQEEQVRPRAMACRRVASHPQLRQEGQTAQPAHLTPRRHFHPASPRPPISPHDLKRSPDDLASKQADLEPLPMCEVSTADTSTQTENFFSTELCRYLRFYQRWRLNSNGLEVTALDLSLPHKTTSDPEKALLDSANTLALEVHSASGVRGTQTCPPKCSAFRPGKRKVHSTPPPGSSQGQGGKGAPRAAQGKAEATPSPQSEAEPKSSDTTASSEDNEASAHRADMMQVKAVQMRLNESFFFRAKGEGRSPRPESPLMKLIQGRDKKNKSKR